MKPHALLLWLAAYAMAMALVEAAIVVHLRHVYYPENPLALFPLRLLSADDLALELARELASVVMILAVAMLAARGVVRRFAVFVYVFGLWDLFYYIWLKVYLGWPAQWLEWDILFLIPWPWFGPWLAPVLIALLFTFWGGWALATPRELRLRRTDVLLFVAGALAALTSFLTPAWRSRCCGSCARAERRVRGRACAVAKPPGQAVRAARAAGLSRPGASSRRARLRAAGRAPTGSSPE